MFCGQCGEANDDGQRFCIGCGSALMRRGTQPGPADTLDNARTRHAGELYDGRILAGRYRIERRLGAGGMGEVWKAVDAELGDQPVAIKVLPPELSRHERSVQNLKREAALALKLTHPSICRLHTFASDGDLKFLVMELVDGQTLDELLDSQPERRLTLDALLPIARDAAAALDYAHDLSYTYAAGKPVHGILHRDIKPSNIMVSRDGAGRVQAKVLDFGIARELKDSMTRVTERETSGTLLYMSPEQYQGQTPTRASDVYSLAATLYECLAGKPPFHQGAIGHQLLHLAPVQISGLPRHVNDALLVGLAKTASDRPATCVELVNGISSNNREAVAAGCSALKSPFGANASETLKIDCGSGIALKLKLIQAGTFTMGSPNSEQNHGRNEGPQHRVTISKAFCLGVTEVTQGQWQAVMGSNPSKFKGDLNLPVEKVSWEDCQEFCRKLSAKTGRTIRLPTEAEWEYACRAGTTTRYSAGDSGEELKRCGWYNANSDNKTHVVAQKEPNAWGLYDMHGNVWEWCQDRYVINYESGAVTDPAGPSSGEFLVLRGGSWHDLPWLCRSALRCWGTPGLRNPYLGFRVVSGTP